MSETAPRSNPRLENFDANKAKAEHEAWEDELYGEAGTKDFSDEARARVEEADAYDRYMEQFASDERSASDRNYDNFEPLEGPVPGTPEYAEAEAHAEKQAREDEEEARLAAEEAAREAKFAADPKLRRMNMIAEDIANRRAALVTPENQDTALERIAELEDKLNELLVDYEASDDFDPIIADRIMDRSGASGETEAAKPEKDDDDTEKTDETSAEEDADKEKESEDAEVPPIDTEIETGEDDKSEKGTDVPPIDTEIEPGEPEVPPIDIDIEPGDDDAETDPAEGEKKESRFRRGMKRLKEIFTNPEKRGTRRAVAVAMGAVTLAGMALMIRYGFATGGGASHTADQFTSGGTGGVPHGGEVPTPDVFTPDAHTVTAGEGWLSELNQLGIPKEQHADVLNSLLSSTDPDVKEWVYQMKDGNPGISHTGQIPSAVLEKIQNFTHR